VLIERTSDGDRYLVTFRDSESVYSVKLNREANGWDASCRKYDGDNILAAECPGWKHHDGPCAHLWAARSYIARERRQDPNQRYDTASRSQTDGGMLR
jgi:hypothetical protein